MRTDVGNRCHKIKFHFIGLRVLPSSSTDEAQEGVETSLSQGYTSAGFQTQRNEPGFNLCYPRLKAQLGFLQRTPCFFHYISFSSCEWKPGTEGHSGGSVFSFRLNRWQTTRRLRRLFPEKEELTSPSERTKRTLRFHFYLQDRHKLHFHRWDHRVAAKHWCRTQMARCFFWNPPFPSPTCYVMHAKHKKIKGKRLWTQKILLCSFPFRNLQ